MKRADGLIWETKVHPQAWANLMADPSQRGAHLTYTGTSTLQITVGFSHTR